MFTTKGSSVKHTRAITPHKNVGMFKSIFNKKSKQDLAEKKLSFKRISSGSSMKSSKHSGGVSPSVDEFDKMMSKVSGGSKKKSMFRKKN